MDVNGRCMFRCLCHRPDGYRLMVGFFCHFAFVYHIALHPAILGYRLLIHFPQLSSAGEKQFNSLPVFGSQTVLVLESNHSFHLLHATTSLLWTNSIALGSRFAHISSLAGSLGSQHGVTCLPSVDAAATCICCTTLVLQSRGWLDQHQPQKRREQRLQDMKVVRFGRCPQASHRSDREVDIGWFWWSTAPWCGSCRCC